MHVMAIHAMPVIAAAVDHDCRMVMVIMTCHPIIVNMVASIIAIVDPLFRNRSMISPFKERVSFKSKGMNTSFGNQ